MVSLDSDVLVNVVARGAAYLLSTRKTDGGFGWIEVPSSDGWTTAECVLGLTAAGSHEATELGLQWLRHNQLRDGSWASEAYRNKARGKGDVAATTYALRTLAIAGTKEDSDAIKRARDWLVSCQRSDGGWGIFSSREKRSHVGQTAYAISALAHAPVEHRAAEAIQDGMFYLYSKERLIGGWELAPGQEMDATLTAYALRGLIDVCALRGVRPQPQTFINWLNNIRSSQHPNGSWSDWYGNTYSLEATGFCIEIACSINLLNLGNLGDYPWLKQAVSFIVDSQGVHGGWGTAPDKDEAPWVTHSVLIAISKLLGTGNRVALSLPALETFPNFSSSNQKRLEEATIYDFAISFAGPDREYAKALALKLQLRGASVFYDTFETDSLWGTDLVENLMAVYKDRAHFCIMLISKPYIQRMWPRLELRSAQARALTSEREYILPIKLERNVDVPGLLETLGSIDASELDIDTIAGIAMRKLDKLS